MAEYLLVTVTIVSALYIPVPGIGESVVSLVLEAFTHFQSHSSYMLSLP